jgi:hypothetical protein
MRVAAPGAARAGRPVHPGPAACLPVREDVAMEVIVISLNWDRALGQIWDSSCGMGRAVG